MQVFSEPENMMNPQSTPPPHNNNSQNMNNNLEIIPREDIMDENLLLSRADSDSYDPGDNTYATIQPRTISSQVASGDMMGIEDYATLRNNHSATPSVSTRGCAQGNWPLTLCPPTLLSDVRIHGVHVPSGPEGGRLCYRVVLGRQRKGDEEPNNASSSSRCTCRLLIRRRLGRGEERKRTKKRRLSIN